MKEKKRPTTLYKRNAGEGAKMKVFTQNKLNANLTSKCLEIPHYAYT